MEDSKALALLQDMKGQEVSRLAGCISFSEFTQVGYELYQCRLARVLGIRG